MDVWKKTGSTVKGDPIAERLIPPVSGIDLEQSMNYVREKGIGVNWFYESYTYLKTYYKRGSRPALEAFIDGVVDANAADSTKVDQILDHLKQRLPHPIHVTEDCMCDLHAAYRSDLGMSEEEIIKLGYGWCNEQARVFIALSQIVGMPSRMLFTSLPNKTGHVMSEVYVDGKWGIVDQTSVYAFRDESGQPVNVRDLRENESVRSEMNRRYRSAIVKDAERAVDGRYVCEGTGYSAISTPIDLFHKVAYLNYFIH